jgi:hypothetical protein
MTFAPSAVPTTSNPTHAPTGVDNVYVCLGANVTVEGIDNALLYDTTSVPAVIAGIAQSTGIPYIDVTYDKDGSLLCPVSDDLVESQQIRNEFSTKDKAQGRRFLADETALTFAIRKPLLRK